MGEHKLTGTPKKRVAPNTHTSELQSLAELEKINPDIEPLAVQTVLWLTRAHDAAISAQTEELRPLQLSPSAFNMLMALRNAEDHTLEPCQLADQLLVSRPSVTGLLDTLQRRGLIERRPHGGDRRRLLVVLTDAGHELLDSHFPHHYRLQSNLVADLSSDEQEQLVTLLRRIRGAVPSWLRDPSGNGEVPSA